MPSCSTTPMSAATPWWTSLSQLFRLQPDGKPMTIMQLAGFPAEVVDSVVSVLVPHGLRVRAVERRRGRRCCSCARRRTATRLPTAHRLRPDPQGALAHRQGRPQVRRLPRARHAAPGRARRDHHLPVQHALRDAHGERARPGASSARRSPTRPPACSASCPRSARARSSRSARAWRLPTRLRFSQLAADTSRERIGEQSA